MIKALRAHDESLVDEAEFRRKVKVVSGDDKSGDGEGGGEGGGDTLPLDFPALPIDAISEAVYAAIPKKLGDREYWSEWAKSIGPVAERLIARIKAMIDGNPDVAEEFARFLKGLQDTLNPAVSQDEAIEMLAQHILTMPVFQALFEGTDFPAHNAVGKALDAIVQKLDAGSVDSETESLERFYDNVRECISLAKSDKSKQDIIRNLYDTFFNNAFSHPGCHHDHGEGPSPRRPLSVALSRYWRLPQPRGKAGHHRRLCKPGRRAWRFALGYLGAHNVKAARH